MKVTIPIYFYSDAQQALIDLEIEQVDFDECITENVTFYNINAMTEREANGGATTIYTNGTMFLSPLSIKEIENLMNKC